MEKNYIIKNIKIKNFRGIKKLELLDKFGEKITVLDGENGFGKTTIFDAIEFCLTGTVKRLEEVGKEDKPKTILKNKDLIKEETLVTLEIFDKRNEEKFDISRRIDKYDNIKEEGQKGDILPKENEEIYKLIEGEEKLKELKITRKNFKDIFYISQNDSLGLIKESKDGMKKFIDILLNTDKESSFRKNNLMDYLKIIKNIEKLKDNLNKDKENNGNKIEDNNNKITENKEDLKNKINEIKEKTKEYKIYDLEKLAKIEKIDFIEIENLKNYNFFYPNTFNFNISDLDKKQDNSYTKKWILLKDLKENIFKIHNTFINKKIDEYAKDLENNKVLIQENINYYLYYLENKEKCDENKSFLINKKNDFENYKEVFELLKNGSKELEKKDKLFSNLEKYKNLEIYKELLEIENKFVKIKKDIEEKGDLEKKYNDIFGILISFWDKEDKGYKIERKKDENNFLEITKKGNKIIDNVCPLCSTELEDLKQIEEQVEFLNKKAGNKNGKEKTFSYLFSKLIFEKIEKVIEELEQKLKIFSIIENNKIFNKFINSFCRVNDIEKFDITKFDKLEKIEFSKKIDDEIKNKDLDFLDNEIISKLKKLKKLKKQFEFDLSDDEESEKYNKLLKDFKFLFDKDFDKESVNIFENVEINNIKNNINYFGNKFKKLLYKENKKLKEIIKEIWKEYNKIQKNNLGLNKYNLNLEKINNFYKKRIEFLEFIKSKLTDYNEQIKDNIDIYKKERIKEISIPVFIFLQRILKNLRMQIYLSYNGVKLLSDNSKVIYTLSSGQLEVTMNAVLFANNINQNFSNFNTILIDDPIQSLDDLNILSFINLLRYQFPEKQILISTHDDAFSRFIRYKFWRLYGNNSQKNINMKVNYFNGGN